MNNIIATTTGLVSEFPTHEAPVVLKKAGYEGIEIWPESFWLKEKNKETSFEKMKKAMKTTGLKGVIHSPIKDLTVDPIEKLNICSIHEDLRLKSIDLNLKSIKMAKDLGFHLVNIHPGWLDREKDNPKKYWPILKESFEIIVKEAEKHNIILAIEAMEKRSKEFVIRVEDIKKLISFYNSENLGATLDLVHAFTHGEELPLKHMEELGIHLRHMHVSGHYGISGKTHCPFAMDKTHSKYFRNILKEVALNYDGIITIEGHTRGIIPQEKKVQLKTIKDNLEFVRSAIGGK